MKIQHASYSSLQRQSKRHSGPIENQFIGRQHIGSGAWVVALCLPLLQRHTTLIDGGGGRVYGVVVQHGLAGVGACKAAVILRSKIK